MKEVSKVIAKRMKEFEINYSKRRKRGKLSYPYFVGQLYLLDAGDESGRQEYEMLLAGFDRNDDEKVMMEAIEKIQKAFPEIGGYIEQTERGVVMISFDSIIPDIPTDADAELTRDEIKLKIFRWRY